MAPIPRSPLLGPLPWQTLDWQAANYRQLEALWSALVPFSTASSQALPLIEMRQSEDAVVVCATLPGIAPEAVRVEAQPHSLVLRGQQAANSFGMGGYSASYSTFEHTLPLPVAVRAEQMQVLLQGQSLIITLPKARGWGRSRRLGELIRKVAGGFPELSFPLGAANTALASPLWQERVYSQRQRLGQRWRQLKRWAGQQLHRLGDRLLEDW